MGDLDKFPVEIFEFKNLKYLDVSHNKLSVLS
jgi:Leucine-rich repeat (LRR) protein